MDPSCQDWSDEVLERLLRDRPDVVVAMATRTEKGVETIPEWKRTHFKQLSEAGIPVVAIKDNPRFEEDIPRCIELRGAANCAITADAFFSPTDGLDVPEYDGFIFVDLLEQYCPAGICSVTQRWPDDEGEAEILVYRDSNHLTNTWVTLNSDPVKEAILQALSNTPQR